ncbi:MAG: 2-amino-4-hydroxy-6-hydroxymethyldihydropteridine diphosphokinase [Planctomycetota bacterium]|jgi:2-amino-4-hydroxy-6-hydroxymethyldihydropteridine diphosphokinase
MDSEDRTAQTRKTARVAIALGSNLGDRGATIEGAVKRLNAHPDIEIERVSSTLSNPAVGGEAGQNDYLNGALVLWTDLDPRALLEFMFEIEKAFGRDRELEGHNGARTLDLDLLLYEDQVASDDVLSIPHPRMLERDFVLLPLAEIAPEMCHPVAECTVSEALRRLTLLENSARLSGAKTRLEAPSS